MIGAADQRYARFALASFSLTKLKRSVSRATADNILVLVISTFLPSLYSISVLLPPAETDRNISVSACKVNHLLLARK
jgi:hypothetical protein